MGLVHELHLVYIGQKKMKLFPLTISIITSAIVGYVANEICIASDISPCLTTVFVCFISLNAIMVITIISDRRCLLALVQRYTKNIK